jgi:hypothetical protein
MGSRRLRSDKVHTEHRAVLGIFQLSQWVLFDHGLRSRFG